jgi:hypothetical protein
MQNYVLRKGLVIGIILLFIGASVLPIVSGDEFESSLSSNISPIGDRDQIDQSQIDIENDGQIFRDNIWAAQGIKPIYKIQTRVFVAICKTGSPPNDVTISLRDSLSGPDLTSFSIPKEQIPPYPGILWNEANYDDVEVTPQQSYYIVAQTTGGDDSNYYLWFGSTGNPYPNGELWYSEDYGYWWGVIWDKDLSFETYGRENLPPLETTITGPSSGKPGESYDYTFNAMDSDADDLRYIIDWGDTATDTTDYYESGTDVIVSHTWSAGGSFTITAKAEDEFGMIGPESTMIVTMPRNKATNNVLLYWFLELFPNSFPILRQLFGL